MSQRELYLRASKHVESWLDGHGDLDWLVKDVLGRFAEVDSEHGRGQSKATCVGPFPP